MEAVQIAGFTRDEADRFFGRPDPAVVSTCTIRLRAPAVVRADYLTRHRRSWRWSSGIVRQWPRSLLLAPPDQSGDDGGADQQDQPAQHLNGCPRPVERPPHGPRSLDGAQALTMPVSRTGMTRSTA